jgi:translation initiation factor IF-1
LGWVNEAINELKQNRSVQVQPFGGSMRGRIESGQLVTLSPVNLQSLMENDVVLVRWQSNYLLHVINSVEGDRVQIGNNLGKINGWVNRSDVIGRVTDVIDEPTATATVVSHIANMNFQIRLDNGTESIASVRKELAQKLFRVVPGDRVVVSGLWNRKYQIKSLIGSDRDAN